MKRFFLVICLLLMPLGLHAQEGRYVIPPNHFKAALKITDKDFANVFGLFQIASGSFDFEPITRSVGNLHIAIDGGTLIASTAENERDLRVMLGVVQKPEISFVSEDSVSFAEGKADIKGVLSMGSVKRPVTFEARINHGARLFTGVAARENEIMELSLQGRFRGADFDFPVQIPTRFGGTFALLLEMQAVKQ